MQHRGQGGGKHLRKREQTHREKGGRPGINTRNTGGKNGVGTGGGPWKTGFLVTKSMLSFRKGLQKRWGTMSEISWMHSL